MSFERAIAAYADAEDAEDPFGRRAYIIPKRWTAAHVAKRMLDGFAVIDAITTRPGPRAFGNAWPAIAREWEDLLDEKAWRNHATDLENAMARRGTRPTAAEVDLAEEANGWVSHFLPLDDQGTDALRLWVLGTARGLNVQRILSRRCAQADAMISALRRRMGVPATVILDPEQLQRTIAGVVASANILLADAERAYRAARERAVRAKPDGPKRKSADQSAQMALADVAFARKLAVERVRRIALFEQIIVRAPQARIRRSEVMPGKVFTQSVYDARRRDAADEIADKLDRQRAPIR